MKNTFKIEINSPCDADLDIMQKIDSGFHCSICTKDVIDLSDKSNYEIGRFFSESKNKNICAKLKTTQLEEEFDLITLSKSNNFKYAVAVAASVLLTTNIVAQEKPAPKITQTDSMQIGTVMGTVALKKPIFITQTFTIKGKIINATTSKSFDIKKYPNFTINFNNAKNELKYNPKTGEYSVLLEIEDTENQLDYSLSYSNHTLNKSIPIDRKKIKKNSLNQNFTINPKEFRKVMVAGGIGMVIKGEALKK